MYEHILLRLYVKHSCQMSLRMHYSRLLLHMATTVTEHSRYRKKENFLRQFRDEQSKELKQLTATQFMEIWSHYDIDGINRVSQYF